jgi:uncharacterized protein
VALTHKEIFARYIYAGAITRSPDAIAAMFTEDGVYDAPLVPDGHPLHRLVGRDAIRTGTSVYHRQPTDQATMNAERTTYVLHDTADPDVFIAEIDVGAIPGGTHSVMGGVAPLWWTDGFGQAGAGHLRLRGT